MLFVATATIFLISCSFPEVQSNSFTLYKNESYLIYPIWVASTRGRLELYFKTSVSDAILVYTGGPMTHLYIGLQEGRVHCSLQLTGSYLQHQEGIGRWNDDQWHCLSVSHLSGTLLVQIDAISEIQLQNASVFLFETNSPLYIGGVPNSVALQSAATFASFQGCIGDVKGANHSILKFNLHSLQAISSNGVKNGCEDICDAHNETCNEGECYSNWMNSSTICMCDSFHTGEQCNQDLSYYPIHLSGDSYPCHRIIHTTEPYLPDNIVVAISTNQIQNDAVLITLHNNYSLGVLGIIDGFLSYTLQTLHGEIFTWKLDAVIPKAGTRILNLKRSHSRIELLLYIDNLLLQHKILPITDSSGLGEMEYLCIGDGAPGYPPYIGEISTVLYNGIVLNQQHLIFIEHKTTVYVPSDFKDGIKLWGISLSSGPLSLSFLMESNSGLIMECQFEDSIFNINSINGQMIVTSHAGDKDLFGLSNILVQVCSSITINTWHVLKIEPKMTNHNLSSLAISLDSTICNITGNAWMIQLEALKYSPYVLARHLKDANVNFNGYLSNVTLHGETPFHLESFVLNSSIKESISVPPTSHQPTQLPSIVPFSSTYNPSQSEISTPILKKPSPVNEIRSIIIVSGIAGSVIIIIIIITMTTMCVCRIRCAFMSKYGQYNTRECGHYPLVYYNATLRKVSSMATIISLKKIKTDEKEYYV